MAEDSADTSKNFDFLTFDDFRKRAADPTLSSYERIGFPEAYRAGKEEGIFRDILRKVTNLEGTGKTVIDIGPGCTRLPRLLMDLCRHQGHSLVQIDSREMLDLLPDEPFVTKVASSFPNCPEVLERYHGRVDAILAYSLLHHVFLDSNPLDFIDRGMQLLSHGGQFLIGDVPNVSKRRRFFSSPGGIRYHQEFARTQELPEIKFNEAVPRLVDDSVILAILMRCRGAGFDAYVLPQMSDLPMHNRREDILVVRP